MSDIPRESEHEIQNYKEALTNIEDHARPVGDAISMGAAGRPMPGDANVVARSYQAAMAETTDNANTVKVRNAAVLSMFYGVDFMQAYKHQGAYINQMYPEQKMSEQTFAETIKTQYDYSKSQLEVNLLLFQELSGGHMDPSIQQQIDEIKFKAPSTAAMNSITAITQDASGMGKLAAALGGFPYVATDQLPRLVRGLPMSIPGAIGGAALGLGTSGPLGMLTGGAKGFAIGNSLINFASEVGAMWGDLKGRGYQDINNARETILLSGAAIAGVDALSAGDILSRGLGAVGGAKAAGRELVRKIFSAQAAKAIAGQAAVGGLEEGLTEYAQEMIGELSKYYVETGKTLIGGDEPFDPLVFLEMHNTASTALAMAAPLGVFMGGASTSFSIALRSAKRGGIEKAIKNEQARYASDIALEEEIEKGEVDVNLAAGEEIVIPADTDLTDPVSQESEPIVTDGKFANTTTTAIVKPVADTRVTGVPVGNLEIVGRGRGDDLYISINGKRELITAQEVAEKTGLEYNDVLAKVAAEEKYIGIEVFPQMGTPMETMDAITGIMGLDESMVPALAFTDPAGNYVVTTNPKSLTLAMGDGKIVGAIIDGEILTRPPAELIQELGWEEYFTQAEVTTEAKTVKGVTDEAGITYTGWVNVRTAVGLEVNATYVDSKGVLQLMPAKELMASDPIAAAELFEGHPVRSSDVRTEIANEAEAPLTVPTRKASDILEDFHKVDADLSRQAEIVEELKAKVGEAQRALDHARYLETSSHEQIQKFKEAGKKKMLGWAQEDLALEIADRKLKEKAFKDIETQQLQAEKKYNGINLDLIDLTYQYEAADIYEKAHGEPDEHGSTPEQVASVDAELEILAKERRPEGWKEHRSFQFRGQPIKTFKDVAQLFSVFRSNEVEISHIVYVKDGEVVGAETITAGSPYRTPITGEKGAARAMYKINDRAHRLGADSVYNVHNHPNHNPEPSEGDIQTADRMHQDIAGYKGSVILNGNQFAAIDFAQDEEGGADFANVHKFSYEPEVELDDVVQVANKVELMELANKVNGRETSIFTMNDSTVTSAELGNYQNADQLYDLARQTGSAEIRIVTGNREEYLHYNQLMDEAKGTRRDLISEIILIEEGAVTAREENSQPAYERFAHDGEYIFQWSNTEYGRKPGTPDDIRQWKENLIAKYGIERPDTMRATQRTGTKSFRIMEDNAEISYDVTIQDGVPTIKLVARNLTTKAEVSATATVSQTQYGLEAGLDPVGQDADYDLYDAMRRKLGRIVEEMVAEGNDFDVEILDISERATEMVKYFREFRDVWKIAPIVEARKTHAMREAFGILAEELRTLDEQGRRGGLEWEAIQTTMWEMAQHRIELDGMTSFGLRKIKRQMYDLAHGRMSSTRMGLEVKKTVENDFKTTKGYHIRMPLTKEEQARLEQIEKKEPHKRTEDEKFALEHAALPGLEDMAYEDIKDLEDRLDIFQMLRKASTEFNHYGRIMQLETGIKMATKQMLDYRGEEAEAVTPASAAPLGTWDIPGKAKQGVQKIERAFRNYIINRPKLYFNLIGHIAGRESVSYNLLYRNLEMADRKMRQLKQDMQNLYMKEMEANGVDATTLMKWGREKVTLGGTELNRSQALDIYMHSLAEQNWRRITENGMTYNAGQGKVAMLHPETTNFKAIADAMAADKVATSSAKAMRAVYDNLGEKVSEVYERLYGKKFPWSENYYPIKVAPEYYEHGDQEIGQMKVKDEFGERVSVGHGFIRERSASADAFPVMLTELGALHNIAVAIEQEAKFIHMEHAFFQASKLLYDPAFKASIINNRKMGKDYWDLIESGLQDWAGRQMDIKNSMDAILLGVRKQATRAMLGLNPTTALKAGISWFYGIRYLGFRYASSGVQDMMMHPKENLKFLMDNSPVFRDRVIHSGIPEVNDLLAGKTFEWSANGLPKQKGADYDRILFFMLQNVDKFTVASVMTGAINQAMESFKHGELTVEMKVALGINESQVSNMTDTEQMIAAVTYAEYVAQRTQPDFRPQSRSQFQRGTSLERLTSVFGSFVNITHNMFWDMAHRLKYEGVTAAGIKEAALCLVLMGVVSAGNEGIEAMKNYFLKRDQATLGEMFAKALFNNTFIVRDVNQMIISKLKYGPYSGSQGTDSYTRFLDTTITGMIRSLDGIFDGDEETMIKGLAQLSEGFASFSGLPVVVFGYGTEAMAKYRR